MPDTTSPLAVDNDGRLADFLSRAKLPGRLLFAKLWGSRSHNLQVEGSDWDWTGVYAAPAERFLGMQEPAEFWPPKGTGKAIKADGQDVAFYEARHFARLLLKGNPHILEMLFTDRYRCTTVAWERLCAGRDRFLTIAAVSQYVGYAKGQLHRLQAHDGARGLHATGGSYGLKWAFHLYRVLLDGLRVAKGEPPLVWKEDGSEERELILSIRRDERPRAWVEAECTRLVGLIDDQLELGAAGAHPHADVNFLDDWLFRLRLDDLRAADGDAVVAVGTSAAES